MRNTHTKTLREREPKFQKESQKMRPRAISTPLEEKASKAVPYKDPTGGEIYCTTCWIILYPRVSRLSSHDNRNCVPSVKSIKRLKLAIDVMRFEGHVYDSLVIA